MEYIRVSDETLAGLDQVRIALPDDNLWIQKGSLQLMEKAGMPLSVNANRNAEDDYLTLLDQALRQEQPTAVALSAQELPSLDILAAMRQAEFGLAIVYPRRIRRFADPVNYLGQLALPSGENGALIMPQTEGPQNPLYYGIAIRLLAASQEVVQERMQPKISSASAFVGSPVKRYY